MNTEWRLEKDIQDKGNRISAPTQTKVSLKGQEIAHLVELILLSGRTRVPTPVIWEHYTKGKLHGQCPFSLLLSPSVPVTLCVCLCAGGVAEGGGGYFTPEALELLR